MKQTWMKQAWIGAALSLLAIHATAADQVDQADQSSTTVGVAYTAEQLSNGTPNWHERTLQMQHQFEKRHVVAVELSEIDRFGLRDERIGVSYARPINKQVTATIDAAFSPSHHVIAQSELGAALQIEFAPAWLLHAGARTTRYDSVTVNQAQLGLEHYFSNFSWAVTLHPSYAFGRTATSTDVRGSYYYGDKNSVSLIAAAGEEAANIGGSVVLTQVRSFAITGRHWLDNRWALNYGASQTRQGDFYNRSGINLGIQYTF